VSVEKKKPAGMVSRHMAQFSIKYSQRTNTTSGAASLRASSASWLDRISPYGTKSVKCVDSSSPDELTVP
jgi:hypothetical protein